MESDPRGQSYNKGTPYGESVVVNILMGNKDDESVDHRVDDMLVIEESRNRLSGVHSKLETRDYLFVS